MAPLSVLPGRVRFESDSLVSNKHACDLLEAMLCSVGVDEATANHRTGRVLVKYNQALMTRQEVEQELERALQAVATQKVPQSASPAPRRNAAPRETSHGGFGQIALDIALHALLPGPLDLLLPIASTALRR